MLALKFIGVLSLGVKSADQLVHEFICAEVGHKKQQNWRHEIAQTSDFNENPFEGITG